MSDRNYICGGPVFYGKGYIALPVEKPTLPAQVLLEGVELHAKDSLHVSLLCVKELVEQNGDIEQKVLDSFCTFNNEHPISFGGYTGEFRFAEDGERKTLVALCSVFNLSEYTACLRTELGIEISEQPAHVTLYTLQPNLGIGLTSSESMRTKSIAVSVPDEVRRALGV